MKVRIAISRFKTEKWASTKYHIECFDWTSMTWSQLFICDYPKVFKRKAEAEEWIRLYKAIKRR